MKKEFAAKLYSEGKITLERTAMEVGISVREMMKYLKHRRVSAQYPIHESGLFVVKFKEKLEILEKIFCV